MRARRSSLRLRLMLGAFFLVALAVIAAFIASQGLSRAEALGTEAIAAQQRMEGYAALSARVNERVLGALAPAGARSDAAVHDALAQIDALIAEDVARAPNAAEASRRAAPAMAVGRIRGHFERLARVLEQNPPNSDAALAALSLYGLQVPPVLAEQIEHERRRRDATMAALSDLRRDLGGAAVAVAVAAPVLLGLFWFALLRPLWLRVQATARAAGRMGTGGGPLPLGPRDELSLLLARMNQMTNRLDRRRARLAQDHAKLETTVAERTAQLRQANDRLSRIDAERRRFFADVSHELRTPLTVILGETELALRQSPPPDLADAFVTIQSRARRLFRRIEDLLRIARSESGQLDLERRAVPLAPLVEAALADLRPLLAGLRVETAVAEGLEVLGDPDWLRQVVAGIAENAAKYAGAGATLRITATPTPDGAVLSLTDDGPGLAPGIEGRALDRFARDGSGAPGFGVGLALARWVVEAQGGSIALHSPVQDGRGLEVRIVLPLAAAEKEELWLAS